MLQPANKLSYGTSNHQFLAHQYGYPKHRRVRENADRANTRYAFDWYLLRVFSLGIPVALLIESK